MTYLSSKCSLIKAVDKCCEKLILQMYNVLSSLEADNDTRLTLRHGHKQRTRRITQPIRPVTVSLYVSQYLCSIHNRKHIVQYTSGHLSHALCSQQSAAGYKRLLLIYVRCSCHMKLIFRLNDFLKDHILVV